MMRFWSDIGYLLVYEMKTTYMNTFRNLIESASLLRLASPSPQQAFYGDEDSR